MNNRSNDWLLKHFERFEFKAFNTQQQLMLAELLQTCIASLHQTEGPLPHIAHFANAVLSEAWFAFR